MDNIEEKIKDKIDDIYGKDITSIIVKYLFLKCKECDEYKKDFSGDNIVCDKCEPDLDKNLCRNCELMYILKYNFECNYCLGNCRIYCEHCRDK